MAGAEGRDWKSRFAPPPPQPLTPAPDRTAEPAPAATTPNPAQPETEQQVQPVERAAEASPMAAPVRRLTSVRGSQPDDLTGTAEQSSSGPDLGDAGEAPAAQPASRSERDQATRLIAALSAAGLDAHLVGVRRSADGPAFDVELGRTEAVQAVVLMVEELTEALDAEEVRIGQLAEETRVRVDVLRGTADDRGKQMAVWVPVELRDAVNVEKDRMQETFTEFFLGAFNRQYARLDTFFPRRLAAPGPMPLKKSRRRRGIATPVQLWLYLNAEQRDVLDDAVRRSGAGSRSALVTKVLESDLEGAHS